MRPNYCECGNIGIVLETRFTKLKESTYRRMECLECGKKWSTVTVRKSLFDKMYKSDKLVNDILSGIKGE